MFAVKPGRQGTAGALAHLLGARAFVGDGFVLPRWLRRPVRLFARLFDSEFQPPRFAASIGTAAFLGVSVVYGAWVGGHMPAVAQAVTSRAGFAVENVAITGHRETSEIDILERLDLDGWTSLVGFDAEAARARLTTLPWVRSASVRKVYPDGIQVNVVEKEAFALWQRGSEIAVIEQSGEVIAPFASSRHATLPLVIGHGARERAADFIGRISRLPELSSRVKAYIRVAERRWDLRLENGITVRLPEGDEEAAVVDLLAMDREGGLLSRDIAAVDMRLADRLVVQLTPEAVERRDAESKQKPKTVSVKKAKRI